MNVCRMSVRRLNSSGLDTGAYRDARESSPQRPLLRTAQAVTLDAWSESRPVKRFWSILPPVDERLRHQVARDSANPGFAYSFDVCGKNRLRWTALPFLRGSSRPLACSYSLVSAISDGTLGYARKNLLHI